MTATDLAAACFALRYSSARLRADERGEGVISAAIAVLIMAALGALMWLGLRGMWDDTEANTQDKVDEIGK